MSGFNLVLIGVLFFTIVVLSLVILILAAKKLLVAAGDVKNYCQRE